MKRNNREYRPEFGSGLRGNVKPPGQFL
jgi:hypothetical protein